MESKIVNLKRFIMYSNRMVEGFIENDGDVDWLRLSSRCGYAIDFVHDMIEDGADRPEVFNTVFSILVDSALKNASSSSYTLKKRGREDSFIG